MLTPLLTICPQEHCDHLEMTNNSRKKIGNAAFVNYAPNLWNTLQIDIREASSLNILLYFIHSMYFMCSLCFYFILFLFFLYYYSVCILFYVSVGFIFHLISCNLCNFSIFHFIFHFIYFILFLLSSGLYFPFHVTRVLRSVVGRFEKKDCGLCLVSFGLHLTQRRPTVRSNLRKDVPLIKTGGEPVSDGEMGGSSETYAPYIYITYILHIMYCIFTLFYLIFINVIRKKFKSFFDHCVINYILLLWHTA